MKQQMIEPKKLKYITYQSFPATTANSLQTISMIKYFVRSNYELELIFPNREKMSSEKLEVIQNYYQFKDNFLITRTDHKYPFGKMKIFTPILFHLSHYLWAKSVIKNLDLENVNASYITRSDWVFYFLSKQKVNVVFECHQVSKIRKLILSTLRHSDTSKVIFTTSLLKNEFKPIKNSYVIGNAFDDDFFPNNDAFIKNPKKVIFVGNLLRFNKSRDFNFIIDSFSDPRLSDFELQIVGGPESEMNKLINYTKQNNIKNVTFYGRLSRSNTIKKLLESKIGILLNSNKNIHSTHHTSPLKYYEYLKSELNTVAVDFPSHRNLPNSEHITFFGSNNKEEFISGIIESSKKQFDLKKDIDSFSFQERVKSYLDIMNS